MALLTLEETAQKLQNEYGVDISKRGLNNYANPNKKRTPLLPSQYESRGGLVVRVVDESILSDWAEAYTAKKPTGARAHKARAK